jgi:hypothetical protein
LRGHFAPACFSTILTFPKAEEGPTEPFKDGSPQLRAGLGNLGKILYPLVRVAGVDNGAENSSRPLNLAVLSDRESLTSIAA